MQGRNVSFFAVKVLGQEVWNFEEAFVFFCPEKFGNGQWGRADKKESLPLLFNSWHCGHLSDEHLSVLDERTIRQSLALKKNNTRPLDFPHYMYVHYLRALKCIQTSVPVSHSKQGFLWHSVVL